ncbi:hypothetical protein PV-S19_0334 [Pacmanvirus S19]|nr:hypothetical protein PV-S19_0334 [Pacmanvirus S19]
MTESLYYLALKYLSTNYHLINFKELNTVTSLDIITMFRDKNYLKNVMTCYKVYNWEALHCYIVKHFADTKYIESRKVNWTVNHEKSKEYIEGYKTVPNNIYRISDKTIHRVINTNIKSFTYKIQHTEFIVKNLSIVYYKPNPVIYDIEFFDKFPGLLAWGLENNYISDKLFIYKENIVKTHQ